LGKQAIIMNRPVQFSLSQKMFSNDFNVHKHIRQ
jgi:hypothetical protein